MAVVVYFTREGLDAALERGHGNCRDCRDSVGWLSSATLTTTASVARSRVLGDWLAPSP